jgi:hypothetical protein
MGVHEGGIHRQVVGLSPPLSGLFYKSLVMNKGTSADS